MCWSHTATNVHNGNVSIHLTQQISLFYFYEERKKKVNTILYWHRSKCSNYKCLQIFLLHTLQNYWTICSCATNHQIWKFCTLIQYWCVTQFGRWKSELLTIIIPWKILIWARISVEYCAEICFLYIMLPSVLSERSTYKCATECAPVKIDTSSQITCKLYKCLHMDRFVLGHKRATVLLTHQMETMLLRLLKSHNKGLSSEL
jgi:hypothetical protein